MDRHARRHAEDDRYREGLDRPPGLISPTSEFVGIIQGYKRDSAKLVCLKLRSSNHHRWSSLLDNGSGCESTRVNCANRLDRGPTIIV